MKRASKKSVPKKRLGRPATGRNPVTAIRLSPEMRATVDSWASKQADAPSRSEAIRRLVEKGLMSEKSASQLAGETIDDLADAKTSTAEKRSRKHSLMKGPEEFRGQREDEAKRRK
jgi:Arc/MetJ-type ribon-helix-helix transcriptional regulator